MKKITILLIVLMLWAIGFFSGCTTNESDLDEKEPQGDDDTTNEDESEENEESDDSNSENKEETEFEITKFDVWWCPSDDPGDEWTWVDFEIENIGEINAYDIDLTIKVERPDGEDVLYESLDYGELKPGERFIDKLDVDKIWALMNSYLRFSVKIYYSTDYKEYCSQKIYGKVYDIDDEGVGGCDSPEFQLE